MAPSADPPAIGDRVPLSVIEELHIRRIMSSSVSLQEAADILGIDQATLWRRRKAYKAWPCILQGNACSIFSSFKAASG
jgi:NtrC-family two-component system response regulator AlgB